jgi:hypothetical protein
MNRLIGLIVGFWASISVYGQVDLKTKTAELEALKLKEKKLVAEIEILKLAELRGMMKTVGYPTAKSEIEIIEHSLMTLGFDCRYNE